MIDLSARLIYRDPWLAAFDKPGGLLSQPGLGPDLADSLITRVRRQWPDWQLVHRLDRDTSGLILMATTAAMHRQLSALFAQRQIRKAYLAEVPGHLAGLGGRLEQRLARIGTHPPRYGPVAEGKLAITRWRRLGLGHDHLGRPLTRVLLAPLTGRSHQLRVQMAELGHPLLGDPLYGDANSAPELRLHAWGLGFRHPATGAVLRLRCLPSWVHTDGP